MLSLEPPARPPIAYNQLKASRAATTGRAARPPYAGHHRRAGARRRRGAGAWGSAAAPHLPPRRAAPAAGGADDAVAVSRWRVRRRARSAEFERRGEEEARSQGVRGGGAGDGAAEGRRPAAVVRAARVRGRPRPRRTHAALPARYGATIFLSLVTKK